MTYRYSSGQRPNVQSKDESYCLCWNNCEHYCHEQCTGRKKSSQIRNLFTSSPPFIIGILRIVATFAILFTDDLAALEISPKIGRIWTYLIGNVFLIVSYSLIVYSKKLGQIKWCGSNVKQCKACMVNRYTTFGVRMLILLISENVCFFITFKYETTNWVKYVSLAMAFITILSMSFIKRVAIRISNKWFTHLSEEKYTAQSTILPQFENLIRRIT